MVCRRSRSSRWRARVVCPRDCRAARPPISLPGVPGAIQVHRPSAGPLSSARRLACERVVDNVEQIGEVERLAQEVGM